MTEEEELELLKKNSPASLPNNPSASGFSTAQIKEKFYAGLLLLYKWFKTLRIDVNAKVDGMQGLREELEAAMETFNKIISGQVPIGSAEKDGEGNVISSTYAKVSGLLEGLYPSLKYITENGGNEEIRNIEPRIMEALGDYAKIADLTEAINNLTSAINSKQNAITSSNKLPYSLLSGTPTIPTIPTNVSYFNNDAGYLTEHQDISGKQNVINENNPLPYDYLSGKPTIPSVYNATINFQLNGTTVKSVSLNQSSGDNVNIVVTKSTVGLSNVDNTSDLNKPISYAVQSALDLKADASSLSGKEDVSHKVTNFTSPNDTNYPTTKAVADMVNSSVSQMASHPLKRTAQGDNFDTKAQLMSATKFYEGGVEKTPTYLDYVIVNNDETHNGEAWRYKYNNQWEQDYKVNNRPFTEAENDALNSGITSTKVATYDGYATLISNLQNGKQDKIDSSHKLAYTLISGTPTKLSDFTNDVGYLTSHQSLAGYATESWVNSQGFLTSHQDLSNYATKSWVEGKGYLVSSSLNGYATQSWVTSQGFLTSHQDISGKQDKSSLESDVSSKGFTKNTGTVTSVSVKMNGATKGTVTNSGEIDLGTVITAHQDISGKADTSSLSAVATSGNYNDLSNKPTIPNGITEISTQYTRIWGLATGVYKLTYNGTKYLYYNGSTATNTMAVPNGEVILFVNNAITYICWHFITVASTQQFIYYGQTSSSSGNNARKPIADLQTENTKYYMHYIGIVFGDWVDCVYIKLISTSNSPLSSMNDLIPYMMGNITENTKNNIISVSREYDGSSTWQYSYEPVTRFVHYGGRTYISYLTDNVPNVLLLTTNYADNEISYFNDTVKEV